jgi:hypothetical protein
MMWSHVWSGSSRPDRLAAADHVPFKARRFSANSRTGSFVKSLAAWTSRPARSAARRGRRLRIMFTDEARFGRMNRVRPCWAPVGTRPEVAAQLIREYIYLYGAVSPKCPS